MPRHKIPSKTRETLIIAISLLPICATAARSADRPVFDVASIKLNTLSNTPTQKKITRAGINYTRVTVFDCIADANNVAGFQVSVNGDSFRDVLSQRYDIVAKPDHESDKPELMSMLQSLLEDRFKLKLHRNTKEVPVFLLTTTKKKLSIKQVEDQGAPGFHIGPGTINFTQTSMNSFAAYLANLSSIQRPVLDRTSLTGVYDFTMSRADGGVSDDKSTQNAGPSIFDDIQDLGLKLESAKAPVEMLRIDHVEKPSSN